MALERVWIGEVVAGHEAEHDEFVHWLSSEDGARMFRQYRLTGYQLQQAGSGLVVTMRAADPPTIVHFLRNHRAWPTFWEFQSNTAADAPENGDVRVQWNETDA